MVAPTRTTASRGAGREHEVLRRLRGMVRKAGFDAVVALSQDNVTYMAGFLVPSHATNRFRRTIAVLAGDDFAAQIVVNVEEEQAIARSRFSDIRSYDQFREFPADVLADALREAGAAEGRIAIELDFIPAADFVRLRERLPHAVFEECKDIFFGARMIKTDEEVATLKEIGALTERVMHESLAQIRVGMSELDVARLLVDRMIAGGSTNLKYRVGSGTNSSVTNCGTTHRQIERDDIIRVEVLGDLDNYRSNVTRTAVAGKPSAEQERIWNVLIDAREACKAMLRPGTPVAELYRTYVDACRRQDVEPTLKFLGHGIGLTVHEEPYITETRDIVFAPNMIFTMEPLYMRPAQYGFHVEDMYRITESGYEQVTGHLSSNDTLIEVG